jgi:hypothetical protein
MLSFKAGTEAREERDEIAEKLAPVSGVKNKYAVATKIVKDRHVKEPKAAPIKKSTKRVGKSVKKHKGLKNLRW